MSIDNDWLLENLSGSYSLGAVDDAVDSLIEEYDGFIDKISEDKRNYMMEAVSTMKEKIITSRVENVLELIDSTQFADGDEFRTIGSSLSIVARKYIDGGTGSPAWTIEKISQEMGGDFEPISKIETAAIQKGYSSAENIVSVDELTDSNDALPKSSSEILVSFAEIDNVSTTNPNSLMNISTFLERYIPSLSEKDVDIIKLTIDPSLKNIKLSVSEVSFIEQEMTDSELKGSGSKISSYLEVSPASSASLYQDTVQVILNYEEDYVITVGGVDYVYTSSSFDTAEDIAAGLESELGSDSNLSISTDVGYWSTVHENFNGDKVFGWYAENSDDSLMYEVEMVIPSDVSDLTIEQDFSNPEKIIITFEHDGFDPVYPTIGDIENLVNTFMDVDINVVVMPGFLVDDTYDTADNFSLEIGASKLIIEASSVQTISTTGSSTKMEYAHISDFSEASSQVGTFEVIKFNPTNTYYIIIDGVQIDIDPNAPGNESVTDEASLAARFSSIINNGSYAASSVASGNTVTLTGVASGNTFPITTSGEFNYVDPITRDTLLRYDIRNLPGINAATIPQLKKSGAVITSLNEPLNRLDVDRLSTSGIIFNDEYMMLPQVPDIVDDTNSFVPKVSRSALALEGIFSSESTKIDTAEDLVSPVVRSMANLVFPMYSTEQAKSDRWFFVEAGANSIASKSTIGVATATISPLDYERLVLQDADATFSSVLSSRLPNVGQKFESLTSLLTEKIPSYNSSGKTATIRIPSNILSTTEIATIKDFMTDKQLDGFIKYALLPQIVGGADFIDADKSLSDALSILSSAEEVYTIAKSEITSSYKIVIGLEELGIDKYAIMDLFVDSRFNVLSVNETVYYTGPVYSPISHDITEIVLQEALVEDFIIARDARDLYRSLLELAIQIDDPLIEQRFIALAGSYVIDASDLLAQYSDELFADYVFGVNESEIAPDNNYGIGGTPIDATVTMSKLYFRNMRSQALQKPAKDFSLGSEITTEKLFSHLVPALHIASIVPAVDQSWGVVSVDGKVLDPLSVSDVVGDPFIPIPDSTPVEDKLYREVSRTGYFSSNVSLGFNHAPLGISVEFEDSIWNLLMDAIEISDDGTIVSINSARSYIQEFYQSFNQLTETEFCMMLLKNSAYFNMDTEGKSNIYSPIITLFLKILLYFKEKKGSIDYIDWEANFDTIVGLLFMDDEFETTILPYEMFLVWVSSIGAHKAFSWSSNIITDVDTFFSGLDVTKLEKETISMVAILDVNGEASTLVSSSEYTISWAMSEQDDAYVPSVSIATV